MLGPCCADGTVVLIRSRCERPTGSTGSRGPVLTPPGTPAGRVVFGGFPEPRAAQRRGPSGSAVSTEPSSRAAEVLERLARPTSTRGPSVTRGSVSRAPSVSRSDATSRHTTPPATTLAPGAPVATVTWRRLRPTTAGHAGPGAARCLAVAILAIVALVVFERRPAPIEQRLPMAASTTAGSVDGSTPTSGPTADGGSDAERPGTDEPGARIREPLPPARSSSTSPGR